MGAEQSSNSLGIAEVLDIQTGKIACRDVLGSFKQPTNVHHPNIQFSDYGIHLPDGDLAFSPPHRVDADRSAVNGIGQIEERDRQIVDGRRAKNHFLAYLNESVFHSRKQRLVDAQLRCGINLR